MGQIMRLRRIATNDHHIVDQNNGARHEEAFVGFVRDLGLNHEAELLPRSYGGNSWFAKLHPAAAKELLASWQIAVLGLMRGKITPKLALFGHKIPKRDRQAIRSIYDKIEGREGRYELNLYITGEDEQPTSEDTVAAGAVVVDAQPDSLGGVSATSEGGTD
jgi:succinate dehydrogenase / fumarate reductase iron-sulfur subunit